MEPAEPIDFLVLDEHRAFARQGGCAEGVRPCPFVSCRHNLFLDVDAGGNVVLNFPEGVGPEDVPPEESCSIDVAMRGGKEVGEIARLLTTTEEEVEEAIERGAPKMRDAMRDYEGHGGGEDPATPLGAVASREQGGVEKGLAADEDDRGGRVLPDRLQVSLLAGSDWEADEYGRAFWKVYERQSRAHCEELAEKEKAERLERAGDAAYVLRKSLGAWAEVFDDDPERQPTDGQDADAGDGGGARESGTRLAAADDGGALGGDRGADAADEAPPSTEDVLRRGDRCG